MNDQATRLREAVRSSGGAVTPVLEPPPRAVAHQPVPSVSASTQARRAAPEPPRPVKLARAIAVCSGKGGVGKSNLAVNLAVAMSGLGLKVCLLDADLGLANADLLCNLSPRLTLEHVMTRKCRLAQAALLAPGGFRLIPGASGVARMADMGARNRQELMQHLAALERVADVLIVDTGAGISANVMGFAVAAHTVTVVTTPEPTAITDSYGLIKSLAARTRTMRVEVLVNQVTRPSEGEEVFARLDRVSRTFLQRSLGFAGAIPDDPAVPEAVRARVPFVLYAPDARASAAVWRLARRLAGQEETRTNGARIGFFSRLASWLSPGGA